MKMFQMGKTNKRQFGQGMTEYIIIVALIAIAAIGVFTAFGGTVRSQIAGMAMELSGQDGSGNIGAAGSTASTASGTADAAQGLSNYSSTNH